MAVLADTSGLYAILDADDRLHAEAAAAWTRLVRSNQEIVMHHFVALESWTLTQARLGMEAVGILFRDHWPLITVVSVNDSLLARGMARCLGAQRRDLSLTDCVSFEFARERGMTHAFAFDAHFREAGLALPGDDDWPGP